jgi:hypothetical protein
MILVVSPSRTSIQQIYLFEEDNLVEAERLLLCLIVHTVSNINLLL